jgi:hypothetical protein
MSVRFTMTDTGIGIRENFLDRFSSLPNKRPWIFPSPLTKACAYCPGLTRILKKCGHEADRSGNNVHNDLPAHFQKNKILH